MSDQQLRSVLVGMYTAAAALVKCRQLTIQCAFKAQAMTCLAIPDVVPSARFQMPATYNGKLFLTIDVDPPKALHQGFKDRGCTPQPWREYMFFVQASHGMVYPVEEWGSDSTDSDALYPWIWDFCDTFSNMPGSLALQIMPQGKTSCHRHPNVGLGDTAETFYPLTSDRKTIIHRDGHAPVPLTAITVIPVGCGHKLTRDADGFSLQLVHRNSVCRFRQRNDHELCDIQP